MLLTALRLYLLFGLIAHKVLWELMKRRLEPASPAGGRVAAPLPVKLVKAAKIAILLGIVAQTLLPEILPISPSPGSLQLAGVALYTIGLALAMAGRFQLGDNWLDIENAAVKRQQAVVSKGLYRYIRHPIYSGDLIMLFGLELALNSWLVILVFALATAVYRQAVREEGLLLDRLPGYDVYCGATKRFIPFVF